MSTSAFGQQEIKNKPFISSDIWQLLGIWFVLRLLTGLWATLVSPLHPNSPLEEVVPLWPPSPPWDLWLQRALAAPWLRRDAVNYLGIVANGYRLDDGSPQFHPLFPWLAGPIAWLTGNPLLALLIVSSIAAIAMLIAFERLASLDLEPAAVRMSTLLLLFFPPAFIFFAPYTEGLFVLFSVLCFYWARTKRWWLAGLAGALATLTRQQGLFLILPMAWELWEAAGRKPGQIVARWREWLALALIPAGFLLWLVYRALALSDFQPDFSNLQNLIYSVVISPSSNKVVPAQAFWWPWQAIWFALAKFGSDFEYSLGIDLALAGIFMLMLVLAWPRLRISYRLHTIILVLVAFAYHTGPFYPYMGLPRHLLIAFPVFIGLGPLVKPGWQRLVIVGLGIFGIFFLLLLYVIRGWVP